MPISLDNIDNIDKLSCKELKNKLISKYETMLKNGLIIDYNKLYELLSFEPLPHECRYVYIDVSDKSFDYQLVFDTKYDVPVVNIMKENIYDSMINYNWLMLSSTIYDYKFHNGTQLVDIAYIILNRGLFCNINSKYSEALKTYKRFIELKGE